MNYPIDRNPLTAPLVKLRADHEGLKPKAAKDLL
jgi:hypothetical protein